MFDWLVDQFTGAGPVEYTGTGPIPLSSAELSAWIDRTGAEISPWAFEALRAMSRAYLSEKSLSEESDKREPPYPWADYLAYVNKQAKAVRLARRKARSKSDAS
jgi:hypothetical protein